MHGMQGLRETGTAMEDLVASAEELEIKNEIIANMARAGMHSIEINNEQKYTKNS